MTALASPADLASPTADISLATAAGRTLIAAGAIFGAANLFQGLLTGGTIHASPALLAVSWPCAVIVFFMILARLRHLGGPAAKRAAVWSRYTIGATVASALGLVALSAATGDWSRMMWMSVAGLLVYAVAWSIAAVRTRRLWIAGVALGCVCAAGGVAQLVGSPAQYLAYACGLFAFALIPGLVLAIRGRI